MEEMLFTEQEQGKATDCLSIDQDKDGHQAVMFSVARGYFKDVSHSYQSGNLGAFATKVDTLAYNCNGVTRC
jgi:hypothetical protein